MISMLIYLYRNHHDVLTAHYMVEAPTGFQFIAETTEMKQLENQTKPYQVEEM